MTFEVSDFFAPSSFNGSYEPRKPLRKHLFIDCKRCHELNEETFTYERLPAFRRVSYWLEIKKDSVKSVIGEVFRYYDNYWQPAHHSYVKFSDGKRMVRGQAKELELYQAQRMVDNKTDEPLYRFSLHLMNDHYDQSLLENLVNNPGWIPNGWHGWFEELPKKMMPPLLKERS